MQVVGDARHAQEARLVLSGVETFHQGVGEQVAVIARRARGRRLGIAVRVRVQVPGIGRMVVAPDLAGNLAGRVLVTVAHALPPPVKSTGLSMIALCLPILPCATRLPSTSTMTRVAKSEVISEVS